MAEEDNDQKTEQPTGKRLDEARERGQLPISREAASWVLFLGILTVVAWLSPYMAQQLIDTLRVFIEMPESISLDDSGLRTVFMNVFAQVGFATVAIFSVLAAAAILGTMVQTGLFASLELIRPDPSRLSPMAGLKRIASLTSAVELGKSFGKMVLLGLIAFITLLPVVQQLPMLAGYSLTDMIIFLHKQAVHLITMLLMVFTVIAVADLYYQRYTYMKRLRMTKAEVKDEFKQQEGDPVIKSRLRQLRLEKARKRMMAQVPNADVVITNPTHYAVAMKYDSNKMAAPRVLAKGVDRVAERIREVATEHKIPMVSNPPLARALYDTVDIDQEIPAQHYRAVAEIISYVYKLRKRRF